MKPQLLTQDTIKVFIKGIMDDEVKAEKTRLHMFRESAVITDVGSFKAACKELAKDEDQAVKQRISEIRQLYGAVHFVKLDIEPMGYHKAVQAARKALADAKLKYDGSEVKSDQEKAGEATNRLYRRAAKEVNAHFDWTQAGAAKANAEAIESKVIDLQNTAQMEAVTKATAKIEAEATAIVAKGVVYAEALIAAIRSKLNHKATEVTTH
jgi:hypothetical protein